MGITENRTILRKAQLAVGDLTTDGGLLVPRQSARFIRVLIKQSRLLQDVFVRPMGSPKELIETIRFGSRVLRPGVEGVALPEGDRVKPDLTKKELDAKLFKAEAPITDEVFEDNIERTALRNTLMQILSDAVSRDMEEVIINGDTASIDAFLAQFDGVLKQTTSNVVDATSSTLTKSVLKDTWKAMPKEFRRLKDRMRFYTNSDAVTDYADSVSDRATGAGDQALQQNVDQRYTGVPVVPVSLYPELTSGPDVLTQMTLTDPMNIRVGIHRAIRMEVDRDVRAGITFLVVTMRMDVKLVTEEATVKTIAIKIN